MKPITPDEFRVMKSYLNVMLSSFGLGMIPQLLP
jgi:hypothetical protein